MSSSCIGLRLSHSSPIPTPTSSSSNADSSTTSTSSSSPTPTYSSTLTTSSTTSFSSTPGYSRHTAPSAANQVPQSSSSSSSSSNTGAIVGGVVGGVAFLSCIALGLFLYMRRRRRKRIAPSSEFINSLRPGVAPVFMLESSPAQVPEKSKHSHHPLPTPYQQDAYYASSSPSSMDFPASTVSTDRSPGHQNMEKPLVPNRYSSAARMATVDAEDRQSSGSGEWDGDPVIETPRRTRSRRPESAPAFAARSSSSHHQRSHHQHQLPAQNSYPGVSPLGVSPPQISGFDRFTYQDDFASPPTLHRGTSLRPQRREDYERVWEER
ncbi:hypothetical protein BKA83DRAFT_368913 [Pisolithus microcarpus]|nr:hypothetical protein BKA83DRAFT_368913 [Pisolithus microcarpus]